MGPDISLVNWSGDRPTAAGSGDHADHPPDWIYCGGHLGNSVLSSVGSRSVSH